jgi:hypothetical protein
VGPRAGMDRCGGSPPTGIRSLDLPTRSQSLYRLRYPAHFYTSIRVQTFFKVINPGRTGLSSHVARNRIKRSLVGTKFCDCDTDTERERTSTAVQLLTLPGQSNLLAPHAPRH